MGSGERTSFRIQSGVRSSIFRARGGCLPYTRQLLKTSALSTIALALSGFTAAQADPDGLWQPQVRAIIGADNHGANAALEGFIPLKQTAESVLFLDVRGKHRFDNGFGQDVGIGIRRLVNPDLLVGGYAYANVQTIDGQTFSGATLGIEAITASYDGHLNVYLPFGGDANETKTRSSLSFVGNQLLEQISVLDRRNYSAWGIEGEFGVQVPLDLPDTHSVRLDVGGYHFADPDHRDGSVSGVKAGIEYTIRDAFGSGAELVFTGEVRNDNRDDTQFAGSVQLSVPFNPPARNADQEEVATAYPVSEGLRKRVNERVRGDIGVRVSTQETKRDLTRNAIDAATGKAFGTFFFADGENTLGLGTQGDPTTLDDAVAKAGKGGFVIALGGKGNILTAGAVLARNQAVIGGAGSVQVLRFFGGIENFGLGGSNGTIAGTDAGKAVLSLANGDTISGITVTGGGVGILGADIDGATLTGVTVSGTGSHGVAFTGSATGVTTTNLTSSGNKGDGLHIESDGTFNFTGTTLLSGNAGDGLDVRGKGTYAFLTLNAANNAGDGIHVVGTASTGTFSTTGGTVSGNGGIAVFIDPIGANVVLDTVSQTGGTAGIVLDQVSGSVTVKAKTSITGTSGAGISISNTPAAIRFGDVDIDKPGGNGISFAGVNAAVAAGNIVISGLGLGATGLDFSGSRTVFTAQSASISGGAIGVDLAGTLAGSRIAITDGGTIVNGGTGVRLGIAGSLAGTANADFGFGGGTIGGSRASLDARGLDAGAGTYAFGATAFAGAQLFDIRNLMFVGAAATGKGDGSSIDDLATIAQADASTASDITFILVNRGSAIDAASGFTLGSGQVLGSFGNGRSFSLGGVPLNVTGANIRHAVSIADAGGAATMTSSAGSATVKMASGSSLLDVNLTNARAGGGTVVEANGVSNIALAGVAISGGAIGFLGIGVNGAVLTDVSVSGAGQDGVVFETSTNIAGKNLTSTGNGNAGLLIASDGLFNFTGTTLLSGNTALGLAVSGDGDYRFETLNALDNAGGGVAVVSPLGTGKFSTAAGTISGNDSAALGGIMLGGVNLNVTLTSLTQNGGAFGVMIAGSSGSFTMTGATTIGAAFNGLMLADGSAGVRFGGPVSIANAAGEGILVQDYAGAVSFDSAVAIAGTFVGPGIGIANTTAPVTFTGPVAIDNAGSFGLALTGNSGAMRFGSVVIDQPGDDGISIKGANGAIAFADIDITGLCGCAIGLDLSSSTSTFTAATLDIAGTPGGGSTGIDLSDTNGGSIVIIGGIITGVDTGVQLGINGIGKATADTTFNFGAAGGGSISGAAASIDTRGLKAGSGTYEFNETELNGPQLYDPVNIVYVGAVDMNAGDGSSIADLISAAKADDAVRPANTTFVLVGTTDNQIVDTDSDGFTLADGQSLVSFANAAKVNIGGPPPNVTGHHVISSLIGDPLEKQGMTAPTLRNLNGSAITLLGSNLVSNLNVSNAMLGAAIDGNAGVTGFNGSGITVSGAETGLNLNGAAGTVTVDKLTIRGAVADYGIALKNSSATVRFTGNTRIAGGSKAALLAGNFSGTATFADLDITGGSGFGVSIESGSTGTLIFGAPSSITDPLGAAFSVDSSAATVTYDGTIAQNKAASAVSLAGNTGGRVTFGGAITANTQLVTAISIANNSGGTFNFAGQVTTNTSSGTGVLLDTDTGAAINFTGGLDIATTGGGDGFTAVNNGVGTYGGIVTVTGTGNTIASTGNGLLMGAMEVGGSGIEFDSISAKSNGAGAGIALNLVDLTGDVNIGGLTDTGFIGGVFAGLTGSGKVDLTGTIDLHLTDPFSIGFAFGGKIGTVNIAGVAGSTLTIDGAWHGIEFSGALGGTANIGGSGVSSTITAAKTTGSAIVLSNNTVGAPVLNYSGAINVSAGNVVSVSGADLAVLNLAGTITSTTSDTAFDFNVASGSYDISSSIAHTGGAGVNVAPDPALAIATITFSGTSKTFNTGVNNAVSMEGDGTLSFTNGGLGVTTSSGTGLRATSGTVNVSGAAGNTINSTAGTAVSINKATAGITLNSVTAAGGPNGVVLGSVAGSFSVSGATQVSNTTGDGIALTGNSGTVSFLGATTVTNPAANSAAVDIKGTNGAISFTDLDIALGTQDTTGFDVAGATVNADITATGFDLTSLSLPGTTAVDLTDTKGSATIRLGDTNAAGANTTIGGAGTGPATGFRFSAATDVGFIYGDGEGSADKGSTVKAADIFFAPGNAFPTAGSYNFLDVDGTAGGFDGDTSEATGPTTYYVDKAGTGTGTALNPGTIKGAEASGAKVIVLVDTTIDNTSDVIDMANAVHVGADLNHTLNLASGQILIGLASGQTIDTAPLGGVGGALGTPPFRFSGLNSSTKITAAGNVDSVLPMLTTNQGNTVEMGAIGRIQNVLLDNTAAAGIGVYGTNVADVIFKGGTIGTPNSNSVVTGGGGGALSLSGAANSKVALSNLTLSARGGDIAIVDGGPSAGTMKVSEFGNIALVGNKGEVGGFALSKVVFDSSPTTGVFDPVIGGTFSAGTTADRVSGYGLLLDTVKGNLKFGTTNIAVKQGVSAIFGGSVNLGIYADTADTTDSTIDFGTAVIGAAGAGTSGNFFNAALLLPNDGNKIGFSGDINFTGTNGAGGLRASAAGGTIFLGGTSNVLTGTGFGAVNISNAILGKNADGSGSVQFGAVTTTSGLQGIALLQLTTAAPILFNGAVAISNTTASAISLTAPGDVTFNSTVNLSNTAGGIGGSINGTTLRFNNGLTVQSVGGYGIQITASPTRGKVVFAGPDAVNIANTGGYGIEFNNTELSDGAGGAAAFTSVSATNYGSGPGINFGNGTSGAATFGAVTLSANPALGGIATGIQFGAGSAGTYRFNGTTGFTGGNDDNGISVNNTGAGLDIAFAGAMTVNTGANAVALSDTAGNLAFAISNASSSLTSTTALGTAFLLTGGAGTITSAASMSSADLGVSILNRSGGTVTFSGATTQALRGIEFNSGTAAATIGFTGNTKLDTGATAALRINSSNAISFTGGLDIVTSTGTGIDITVPTAGANLTVSGSGNSIQTTSGTAVSVHGTGGAAVPTVGINSAITTTAGGKALAVDRLTGGTVTLSGDIAAAGAVFTSNSGGTTTLSGASKTLTATGAANALDISGSGGHTVIFSGATTALSASGSGMGVNVAAGATLNFNSTGSTTIGAVSGTAFNASSPGTLVVTGNARLSTTGTGTAVALNGITAGAGGIAFQSVTTSAAAAGVLLTSVASTGGGTIDLGAANLQGITAKAVSVVNTLGAALNFASLDIGLAANSAVGLSLNGATLNANIAAGDFDLTAAAGLTGTTGIDLSGARGSGSVQLGNTDNADNPGDQTSTISGVTTGVLFNGATNLSLFTFGDGQAPAASSIAALGKVIDGTLPGAGNYNFNDVNLVGDVSNLSSIKIYYVDADGDGDGSLFNPGSIANAELSTTANVLILIDKTAGQRTIDMTSAPHVSGGLPKTLELKDGQALISFKAGDSPVDISELGVDVAGGSAPSSFKFSTIQTSPLIAAPAGINPNYRPILSTDSIAVLLPASGTGRITAGVQNVIIRNANIGILGSPSAVNDSTFVFRNNDIGTIATALQVVESGGAASANKVLLSIDGNRFETTGGSQALYVGGRAIDANNSSVRIDSFAGNSVTGNGAGGGIAFDHVGFNPAMTAGSLTIGQNAGVPAAANDRVEGIGLKLNQVTGTLSFTSLVIANKNGDGIQVDNDADNNGTKETNFTLNNTGGAIDTTGGTTLNLDPLNVAMKFGSITGSGGGYGILFDGVTGTFEVTGQTSITGTTVAGIWSNSFNSGGTFNFAGMKIDNAATSGIGVLWQSGGLTVSGIADIDTTTGTGFSATGGTIAVKGSGNTVGSASGTAVALGGVAIGADGFNFDTINSGGGANNIVLTNVTGGAVRLGGGALSGATGPAFKVGAGTSQIDYAGTINSVAGSAVDIQNRGANAGTITLAGNITHNAAATSGIFLSGNSAGTALFSGTIDITTDSADAIKLTNNGGSAINFTHKGLTINTNGGAGFVATGGGTIAVRYQNAATDFASITTGTGTAIDLQDVAVGPGNFQVDSANVTGAAAFGYRFTNVTGGTISLDRGDVQNTTSRAIEIDGGSSNMNFYSGRFRNAGVAGRVLEVKNRTAGQIMMRDLTLTDLVGQGLNFQGNNGGGFIGNQGGSNLSYNINVAGTNNALTVASSANFTLDLGGTGLVSIGLSTSGSGNAVDISGGATLNLRNANVAATGTGGGIKAYGVGTVTISGAATVSTGTGTAVDIQSTTIGSGGVNLRSVSTTTSSSNAGIILNNTGALGGLTITGTGTAGSGGTIANKTGIDGTYDGIGVYLNNTSNVSLNWMNLRDFQNFAVRGALVNGFTLANSVVSSSVGSWNGTNDAGGFNEGSVSFSELTGTASILNTSISGGYADNFRVVNTVGVLNRITFDTVTIGTNQIGADSSQDHGNDALTIEALGTATINTTVRNSTFTAARGDLFQFSNNATGSTDLIFTGNRLSNNYARIATGGGGVTIGTNGTGNLTYDITDNSFRDAVGHALLLVHSSAGDASMIGNIINNTIGVASLADSGSLGGDAIKLQLVGAVGAPGGTFKTTIKNNIISQYNNFGINMDLAGGAPGIHQGTYKAIITGNTIGPLGTQTSAAQSQGIGLNGGSNTGDIFNVYLTLGGVNTADKNIVNNWTGVNGLDDIRLRQRQATIVHLTALDASGTPTINYSGAKNDNVAVASFIQTYNITTGHASATNSVATGGGGFVGGSPP